MNSQVTYRKRFILFSFLCLLFFSSLYSEGKSESLYFKEDGRNWVFVGETKAGEKTYIPENQDSKKWKEAIILHQINGTNIPLMTYYDTFMEILNEKSGNLFESQVIESNENSLIFEWWTDKTLPQNQHGWIKVTHTPQGLQFFRYTTKDSKELEKASKIWPIILKNYSFKTRPEKVDVDLDFSKDDKKWILQNEGKNRVKQLFLPEGETKEDWSEKFSVDLFPLPGMTPYSFYYHKIKELERKENGEVETAILSVDNKNILFTWKVSENGITKHSLYKMSILDPTLASAVEYTKKTFGDEPLAPLWENTLKDSKPKVHYHYLLEKKEPTNN